MIQPKSSGASACLAPRGGTWAPAPVGAARFVVNRQTRGMASRVRWMLSPDSATLIVMDDPAGVENEAIPNGVLVAGERTGRVYRADSVWTAAPSPDWRQLAIARAVVLQGGEQQQVAPARWTAAAASLARLAGPHPALVADSLRAHAFEASGMAVVQGAAATFVMDIATGAADAPLRFAALGGWTLRWSCDAASLSLGDRPRMVQDDSPAASERRVRARPGQPSSAPLAEPARWITGPTLDISVALARGATKPFSARGRTVTERDGRIIVRDADGAERDVGAGIPLAATRGARFILAIAPRQVTKPYESPDEAVVYRVP